MQRAGHSVEALDGAREAADRAVQARAGARRAHAVADGGERRLQVGTPVGVEEVDRLVEVDAGDALDLAAGGELAGLGVAAIEVEEGVAEDRALADPGARVAEDRLVLGIDAEGDRAGCIGLVETDLVDLADRHAVVEHVALGRQVLDVVEGGPQLVRMRDQAGHARPAEGLVEVDEGGRGGDRRDDREHSAYEGDSVVHLASTPGVGDRLVRKLGVGGPEEAGEGVGRAGELERLREQAPHAVAARRGASRARREAGVLRTQRLDAENVDLAEDAGVVGDREGAAPAVGELAEPALVGVEEIRTVAEVLDRRDQVLRLGGQALGALREQAERQLSLAAELVELVDRVRGRWDQPAEAVRDERQVARRRRQLLQRRGKRAGQPASRREGAGRLADEAAEVPCSALELGAAVGGDRERAAAGVDRGAELLAALGDLGEDGVEAADQLRQQLAPVGERVADRGRGIDQVAELCQRGAQLRRAAVEGPLGLADQDLGVGLGVGVEDRGQLVDRDERARVLRLDRLVVRQRTRRRGCPDRR